MISPDRRLFGELVPLLSQQLPMTPIIEINDYPNRTLYIEMAQNQPPSLLFLDTGANREKALEQIPLAAQALSGVPIIVLLNKNDPDLILRCLRSGATEFLLQPLSLDQLQPVLNRVFHLQASGTAGLSRGAKIQLVVPVKGGSGASTIATSLAFQWKRHGHKRVLLADLDPTTGTVPFILKIKSQYSFLDALSRAGSLDSDLWRGLVYQSEGVDVLLSPENPVDMDMSSADPTAVLEFCRQAYDLVTIDVGTPYGRWALSVARLCDEVLLITTNELPALRAAQRVMANFDRNQVERSKVRLVVNRFSSEMGLNQEAIETALHSDVFHVAPSDYETVQRALVEGKPISPTSGIGKSLIQLADRLAGKKGVSETRKSSSLGSLFSSLVSKVSS